MIVTTLIILRPIFKVAQIYQSIEFSRLASLVPFVDAFQLERSIVDAARHCDLQVRSRSGEIMHYGCINTIDSPTKVLLQ